MSLSEKEKELSRLVKTICLYKDTYIGAMLAAHVYGFVDDAISYIKENPDITQEKLISYISEKIVLKKIQDNDYEEE